MALLDIYNKFTDIVASNLHYQDCVEREGKQALTGKEFFDMQKGWVKRYSNDPRFHARVDSMVAALMTALPNKY